MSEQESSEIRKKVDHAWKQRIQEEKEQAEAGSASHEGAPARIYPKADFTGFVVGLAAQALVGLGKLENPASGKVEKDLVQARYTIDILGMLQEKTRGNLTSEEASRLEAVLHELRMGYVQESDPA